MVNSIPRLINGRINARKAAKKVSSSRKRLQFFLFI
jgi:hypothetical protein